MRIFGFRAAGNSLGGGIGAPVRLPVNSIRPFTRPPAPKIPSPVSAFPSWKTAISRAAAQIGSFLSQIWGWFAGRPSRSAYSPSPGLEIVSRTGAMGSDGGWLALRYSHKGIRTANQDGSGCTGPGFSGALGLMDEFTYRKGPVTVIYSFTDPTPCGFKGIRAEVTDALGFVKLITRSTNGFSPPGVFTGAQFSENYWGGAGTLTPVTTPAGPPVPGWEPPELEPQPEVEPAQVPSIPKPVAPPTTTPTPDPERDPSPEPGPGPARPPATPPITVPTIPGIRPSQPGNGTTVRPDGSLPVPVPQPPPITDPDWHFPIPGGKPIVGNGPQVKPEEIAKELGRLEQKLNAVLNPSPDTPLEWQKLLQDLWEFFTSITAGKTYTLTEKCPPCDGGDYDPPTVQVQAPGAFGTLGVILNRIDALALLIDGQLGLKQQICEPCGPTYTGRSISVQFRSTEISPYGERRLRKEFRYRDQSNKPLEEHRDHWKDFAWQSGRWMVISKGLPWGKPRVWASSPEEGKRVLRHAAQIAGVDLTDKKHRFDVREVTGSRERPVLTMWVHRDGRGLLWVSERDGSEGPPLVAADLSPDINVGH